MLAASEGAPHGAAPSQPRKKEKSDLLVPPRSRPPSPPNVKEKWRRLSPSCAQGREKRPARRGATSRLFLPPSSRRKKFCNAKGSVGTAFHLFLEAALSIFFSRPCLDFTSQPKFKPRPRPSLMRSPGVPANLANMCVKHSEREMVHFPCFRACPPSQDEFPSDPASGDASETGTRERLPKRWNCCASVARAPSGPGTEITYRCLASLVRRARSKQKLCNRTYAKKTGCPVDAESYLETCPFLSRSHSRSRVAFRFRVVYAGIGIGLPCRVENATIPCVERETPPAFRVLCIVISGDSEPARSIAPLLRLYSGNSVNWVRPTRLAIYPRNSDSEFLFAHF